MWCKICGRAVELYNGDICKACMSTNKEEFEFEKGEEDICDSNLQE